MQCSDSTPADWLIQKKSFAAYQFQCVSLLMIVCICAQCISSGRSLSFHYWWWLLFFFFCCVPFHLFITFALLAKSRSNVAGRSFWPITLCLFTQQWILYCRQTDAYTQHTFTCAQHIHRTHSFVLVARVAQPPPSPPLTVWWKEKTNRQPSRTLDALVSIASYDICHSTFVL